MTLFWILFAAAALGTLVLARLAPLVSFGDAAQGPAAARKLQRTPVPPVGGPALFVGYGLYLFSTGGAPALWALVPLAGILAVGVLDDALGAGLSPGPKVALMALAIGVPVFLNDPAPPFLAPLALFLALLAATNVTNTFDNADGAVGAVLAVGLLCFQPELAALPLGFLVFNLDSGASWRRGAGAPSAYLGDSGAFLLGALALLHGAWPALWIPFLDIARLTALRWSSGSRPWVGDRRHLAHRLQAAGLGPLAVAGVLGGLTLPGCLGFLLADQSALLPFLGLALGAGIYVLAVRLTPACS